MARRLVAGPPCAGKSTFVRAQALPNERIVDFDDIVEELTGDRYGGEGAPEVIQQARQLWARALPEADWVIWTAPRPDDRDRFRSQHKAEEVFVVWAPESVCLDRARALSRPPRWESLIREWFSLWAPSTSGRENIISTGPDADQAPPVHRAAPTSPRPFDGRPRETSDRRYKTAAWRALRLRRLDADHWRCTAVHEDCRYKAPGALYRAGRYKAHVHHIVDPVEGGDFWDFHNLQSVCGKFNIAERNRRQNLRAARALAGDSPEVETGPSRKW